jgi:membrane-bound serine protease (ClpP class)
MGILASQTIYPSFGWEALVLVVLLVALGVVLLGVELFVVPGFGVGGILGAVSLLGGTGVAWVMLGPAWGALVVVASVALSTALFIAAMRTGVVKRRLVLQESLPRGQGTESEGLRGLVGAPGTAHTDLRPAGIAEIEGKRIDVVSDGGFLERGTPIRVVAVDGPRVVVARDAARQPERGEG